MKFIPARDMIDMLEAKGITVTPILNTISVVRDAASLRTMGYDLHGPRGNRKVVQKERDGTVEITMIELWLEGIEYATNKINRRKVA